MIKPVRRMWQTNFAVCCALAPESINPDTTCFLRATEAENHSRAEELAREEGFRFVVAAGYLCPVRSLDQGYLFVEEEASQLPLSFFRDSMKLSQCEDSSRSSFNTS